VALQEEEEEEEEDECKGGAFLVVCLDLTIFWLAAFLCLRVHVHMSGHTHRLPLVNTFQIL
jgi:hypothetical protein